MKYKLQNRYQDSGWESLCQDFWSEHEAITEAIRLSGDGLYGMVRVVYDNKVIKTYIGGSNGKEC